ncbi:SDR family oxidoreductase, partial [Bacillus altitudinis]|uniref:SDR family oxidoreductase n=1 Tax=Bacillus altitudinis TaxID=293387 RepID=UPI0011A22AC3
MDKNRGGHILTITSLPSIPYLQNYTLLPLSKPPLQPFTPYLSLQFSQKNILLNPLSPPPIHTHPLNHFPNPQHLLQHPNKNT